MSPRLRVPASPRLRVSTRVNLQLPLRPIAQSFRKRVPAQVAAVNHLPAQSSLRAP